MSRYHPVLVALHWLLALMIITGLIMGATVLAKTPNSDPSKLFSLAVHMSIGIAILVLMLVRLVMRLTTAKPPHADIGNPLINKSATLAHWALYLTVLAMCATGLAAAGAAGLPAIVFAGSGDPLPANFDNIAVLALHGLVGTVLALLIGAHVAAAIYHQYIRKDGLFSRMWFGKRIT